ncbi:MAG: Clostripain family protein, partial [Mediterranea sp.]|nr:Clostripain family protein [Mediterranea sp.]
EVMAEGMPYATLGQYLLGDADYEKACDAFYDFYSTFQYPYGTIGVTNCAEVERLAQLMKDINSRYTFDPSLLSSVQMLDGYLYASGSYATIFFDAGDYVSKLCTDINLLAVFNEQLERAVPYKRHTREYYTAFGGGRSVYIKAFSGITISDPSVSMMAAKKGETSWYVATH